MYCVIAFVLLVMGVGVLFGFLVVFMFLIFGGGLRLEALWEKWLRVRWLMDAGCV